MQKVIIADDRPKWMVREDNMMICQTGCSLYRNCSSRFGMECKWLGGTKIAKVREGNGKQGKAKAKVKKGNC